MRNKKQAKESVQVNSSLTNVISPMGLDFKRNSFDIGEYHSKAYGIIKYPQKVDIGWLSRITNIPNTVVSIGLKPVDNSELTQTLSKNIINQRGQAESTKSPLERQRALRAAAQSEEIMRRIDAEGETVSALSIVVLPTANEQSTFNKICKKVESLITTMYCKMRVLPNLQRQALEFAAPTFGSNKQIEEVLDNMMPMSTFVGGLPFASTGFNDMSGYYIGKEYSGGLVILNPWLRGNDRTNTNIVVTGVPGVGKSTVIKYLILNEIMLGTKVLIIDPESEYKYMCEQHGWDWLNAAGGSQAMINPLQIRPAPHDVKENDDSTDVDSGGLNPLALHMKTLDIFFSLYLPSLSDMDKAILKKNLIELYGKFNITWETDVSTLKAEQFPRMSDLYDLIKAKSKKPGDTEDSLSLLLFDIAYGSDSFLWNGHSTINPRTKCVCLDTNALQETSDSIKRTQYFNLLSWCWEQMSANPDERVLLVADEAYLMVDPKVPQSLIFLRNVAKRARKRSAALVTVFHSVVDVLDPSIKMYGQAILDAACIKILMGTDGKNLQETSELFNLSEAEEEILASKKRAHALTMIGNKRFHMVFDLPQEMRDLMGTAGGE